MRSRSPTATSSIPPQPINPSSSFCGACSMPAQPQPAHSPHFRIFACQSGKAAQEQPPPPHLSKEPEPRTPKPGLTAHQKRKR
uniref:Uncharacterized protein n=1 Tax=Arundo donax TaxID=35708 RepID=A0A0A9HLL9_ARUDO